MCVQCCGSEELHCVMQKHNAMLASYLHSRTPNADGDVATLANQKRSRDR